MEEDNGTASHEAPAVAADAVESGASPLRASIPSAGRWITVDYERALYVDYGSSVILCDRLPSPGTLILRVPAHD